MRFGAGPLTCDPPFLGCKNIRCAHILGFLVAEGDRGGGSGEGAPPPPPPPSPEGRRRFAWNGEASPLRSRRTLIRRISSEAQERPASPVVLELRVHSCEKNRPQDGFSRTNAPGPSVPEGPKVPRDRRSLFFIYRPSGPGARPEGPSARPGGPGYSAARKGRTKWSFGPFGAALTGRTWNLPVPRMVRRTIRGTGRFHARAFGSRAKAKLSRRKRSFRSESFAFASEPKARCTSSTTILRSRMVVLLVRHERAITHVKHRLRRCFTCVIARSCGKTGPDSKCKSKICILNPGPFCAGIGSKKGRRSRPFLDPIPVCFQWKVGPKRTKESPRRGDYFVRLGPTFVNCLRQFSCCCAAAQLLRSWNERSFRSLGNRFAIARIASQSERLLRNRVRLLRNRGCCAAFLGCRHSKCERMRTNCFAIRSHSCAF